MHQRAIGVLLALLSLALVLSGTPAQAKLKVTWTNAAHRTSFENELTAAAGKAVTIDAGTGIVSLAAPPPADNAFATRLRTIINDADTTTVAVGRNVATVLVGSFNGEVIDLDDKEQLNGDGQDGIPTEGGGIIHELWEQYQKQVKGKNYDDAHHSALDAENAVSGGTSRRCGGGATREEGGKTVLYIPIKKGDGTTGYARMVLAPGPQIESISFVESIPAPSPPLLAGAEALQIDASYVYSPPCPSAIPTLGEYAMILLVLVLLGAGLVVMRRRAGAGLAA
jgi:hypothetical protein